VGSITSRYPVGYVTVKERKARLALRCPSDGATGG
jgi:hypothetical protein